MGIVGGEQSGIVFLKELSIVCYVGTPLIFRFDKIG
jgi:hypothetical protein